MRLGKPLPLSDAALEQIARITPLDVEAARALWQAAAPLRWKRLLDASLLGAPGTSDSPYAWDPRAGQYVYLPTGRHVPALTIREQAIEPLITRAKSAQRALGVQLQNQAISLAEWQRGMTEQVKPAHVAAALAAGGGEKNTSDRDREKVALLLLALLLLLRGFAGEIATGKQARNGILLVRSDLYASAARGTYEEMGTYVNRVYGGRTQERRVLGDAEHCRTVRTRAESVLGQAGLEGCVELAAKGWQPIGSLPAIGKSPCRSNCKCHKEYR
jgi:hypothetical protein